MSKLFAWVHEPWAINAAQIFQYCAGMFAGFMAVLGTATPQFLAGSLQPWLIATVGCLFILGGAVGTFAVAKGNWGLERISLWIVGVAFFALLPAASYISFTGRSPAVWIVLILVLWALCDVFKRYRRIDWAYLDPAK